MELRLDFYKPDQVAISENYAVGPVFSDLDSNQLFLVISFILRQFSNFGNHPVGMVLAGLLGSMDEPTIRQLAEGRYKYPDADALQTLMLSQNIRLPIDYSDFQKQITPRLPEIVQPRGKAKKSFTASYPPFIVNLTGFGVLGIGVNYYAFQSAVTLIRYLASHHRGQEEYLRKLSEAAIACARIQVRRGVNLSEQPDLAVAILKDLNMAN